METELEQVVRLLAANRWPWRLHATYNETITRALDVFETVSRDIPFDGLHWFFDHAETISDRNIDRIDSYDVVNAQLTLNGPDERWYLRGFVQNLTKNDAITGMYVTDPASGLFTNVFTLEPRRYGIAAGGRIIHELGCVRMGDDPKTSALNANCQAHDCKNLFVADGGPFVSQCDKNPTWTILALAWRTADAITAQRKAGTI